MDTKEVLKLLISIQKDRIDILDTNYEREHLNRLIQRYRKELIQSVENKIEATKQQVGWFGAIDAVTLEKMDTILQKIPEMEADDLLELDFF